MVKEKKTAVLVVIQKYIEEKGSFFDFVEEMITIWPEFGELLEKWDEEIRDDYYFSEDPRANV